MSNTFHGRDVFAPVAAHLAGGIAPSRFGKSIADYLRLDLAQATRTGRRTWTGSILKVDRFGNLVTTFSVEQFPNLGEREFEIAAGPWRINRFARHYAEHGTGEPFLIAGSAGYYEISVGQASAAQALGCGAGAPLGADPVLVRTGDVPGIGSAEQSRARELGALRSGVVEDLGRSGTGIFKDHVGMAVLIEVRNKLFAEPQRQRWKSVFADHRRRTLASD